MVEEIIQSLLVSNTAVGALVGSRVRPVALAQDDAVRAIVYQVSQDERPVLLDGTPCQRCEAVVQVYCLADNRKTCATLANAVRTALTGYRTTGTNAVAGHAVRGIFHNAGGDDENVPQPGQEKPRFEMLREFNVTYL
jgi:hypothetical protein